MATEKRMIDAAGWDSFYADIGDSRNMGDSYDRGYVDALDRVDDWMDAQPTVDAVELVHGRWLKTENGIRQNINTGEMVMAYMHDCSVCGWHTGNQGRNFNYCPNCGAKMDEKVAGNGE